jgi:hypothetical protein
LFLVATVVLGIIAACVTEYRSRVVPIRLNAVLLGELSAAPAAPVEEPTLDEVRHAVDRERSTLGADFSGEVTALKVLAATSSIEPPRMVPLIGNACLHRGMFQCLVKLSQPDGSTVSKVVFVEKNAFRLVEAGGKSR